MSPRAWRMYVDGKWLDAASGDSYALQNPATEAPVGIAPDAARDDVRSAIAAARRAFDEGPWRRTTPRDRSRILERIADGLEARKDEFRELLVSAFGVEYVTHAVQLDLPSTLLRSYAELALSFPFQESLPPVQAMTAAGPALVNALAVRHPAGVDRTVAIKVLLTHIADDPDLRQRFERLTVT